MSNSLAIGIVGYGRVGQLCANFAEERGHNVARIFTRKDPLQSTAQLDSLDCLIDFSHGHAVPIHLSLAQEGSVNMVIGTTGWDVSELSARAETLSIGVFVSPNFSLGANLFAFLVEEAARLCGVHKDYDVYIHEVHHRGKPDSPSGTALKLGELILEHFLSKSTLHPGNLANDVPGSALQITSGRVGNVVSTHEVHFESEEDEIVLKHLMRDRRAFARGAVLAAEWLVGRRGLFGMADYLRDNPALESE